MTVPKNRLKVELEDVLSNSQARLKAVLESTEDGLLIVDSSGKIVDWNDRFVELWHIPQERLNQRDDNTLLEHVVEQLVSPKEFLNKVHALYGLDAEDKDEIYFNDGRIFERHSRPLLVRGENMSRVWAFHDITSRKRAETELLKSEQRLSMAAESAGTGLWILNLSTWSYWTTNKTRELFGFSPDEVLTFDAFLSRIHPDDRELVYDTVETIVQSRQEGGMEFRLVRPDGTVRWLISRGTFRCNASEDDDCLMGASVDITVRKRAEEALEESRLQTLAVMDSTNDLIWTVDPERFGLLTWNRALQDYFMNQRGIELRIGLTPEGLLPPDYATQWREELYGRALREGSLTTEYVVVAQTLTLLISINVLKRGDNVFGISVFGKDITAHKQAEAELVKSYTEIKLLKEQLQAENVSLRQDLNLLHNSPHIIGRSDALKRVLVLAEQVAATDSTVLLLGETGTGKELIASTIHDQSDRSVCPMIRVNCAAIPSTLIESELFGREKGAYTGALTRQIGRFEAAHRSTLFLDEIGELPLEVQVKLLRFLQERQIERLGSTTPISVDVRIIAATNCDLLKAIRAGRFREDLYYRLSVFPITVPPLRDRREDIPVMVRSFADQFAKTMGKTITSISQSNLDALQRYEWPGNVRELRNVVERAMIMARGPKLIVEVPHSTSATTARLLTMEDVERDHILRVLEQTRWRVKGKGGAAEILALNSSTLQSRMAKLGISRPDR